ncbi:GNAT family N-acetyltransferase [Paenibacillus tarimensis]
MYKQIEEMSLNGWPAIQTFVYDGWLLRFSDGYTKRSNSVQPIYASTFDVQEKITYCEQIYGKMGLDTIFKMTPFAEPQGLDKLLAARGYVIEDHTSVQVVDLANVGEPEAGDVRVESALSEEWLGHLSEMMGLSAEKQAATRGILAPSYLTRGFFTLYYEGRPAAIGIGVIEREYIGLYDIFTDKSSRRRGFGEQLLLHILKWGRRNGADKGYLLVVKNNTPAVRLYAKLGYQEVYTYWYRYRMKEM